MQKQIGVLCCSNFSALTTSSDFFQKPLTHSQNINNRKYKGENNVCDHLLGAWNAKHNFMFDFFSTAQPPHTEENFVNVF